MGGERHPDGVGTIPASPEDLASFEEARGLQSSFSTPRLLEHPSDRLFLAAFDGTGNSLSRDAPEHHTNVADIRTQITEYAKEQTRLQGFSTIESGYVEGPGTQGGFSGLGDLASGDSYNARLEDMYLQFVKQAKDWIDQDPNADIRIAAVGFSRGAEQAAGFTRMVEERGIQDPTGAVVHRGGDGLIDRVDYPSTPLRQPGTVVQAAGLFDPVGTGTPRDHDRRLASSVVSGFQITAEHEARNLFQGTRHLDPGVTFDGRFLNVTVAGAHSNVGGSYSLNGLSIRSGNLMVDYLNSLSSDPFLQKRAEPTDPARNVIHSSEEHQFFYRTSIYDRTGARGHQEVLAPETLCRMDCRDAMPRNEAMASRLTWRPVEIGPVPKEGVQRTALEGAGSSPAEPGRHEVVQRLLEASKVGNGLAVEDLTRDFAQSAHGQAWLQAGLSRLPAVDDHAMRSPPPQHQQVAHPDLAR